MEEQGVKMHLFLITNDNIYIYMFFKKACKETIVKHMNCYGNQNIPNSFTLVPLSF